MGRDIKRVVVTGGAGFIGSAFAWRLNQAGIDDILLVDALGTDEKWKNIVGLRYAEFLHPDVFLQQVKAGKVPFAPDAIVHMGACSATTERDADYLMDNNYHYTRTLAEWAAGRGIRFIYASSAATYGEGENGFSDQTPIDRLAPLNMYGYSKHLFDLQAQRSGLREHLVGLKFFNVFGPNEYHKAEQTSVVYKAFYQILEKGSVGLFRSYRPDYADGEQVRDFVYIKDCVEVMWWLLEHPDVTGLYNVGTGQARSWKNLAQAIFAALEREPQIEFIPMPEALQGKYQYRTEAVMDRLRAAGCTTPFRSLEESVADYVKEYLARGPRFLSALS